MPTQRKQSPRVPAYRQRSGYTQAIVTLTDAETGRRRDYWLGEYDTPEIQGITDALTARSR